MKRKIKLVIYFFVFFMALLTASRAQNNDTEQGQASDDNWWKELADTNKDGGLDQQELDAWESQKKLIDLNGDGKIDNIEKRLSWKVVNFPVKTDIDMVDELFWRGKSKGPIRTGLEKLYDNNGDGILDLQEIKILQEDLKNG